jgi:hypothetical protein
MKIKLRIVNNQELVCKLIRRAGIMLERLQCIG